MKRFAGRYQLFTICSITAFVWLMVLPQIAKWPAVKARIERHHAAGINPTAVFYTEHPAHETIYDSVQSSLAK